MSLPGRTVLHLTEKVKGGGHNHLDTIPITICGNYRSKNSGQGISNGSYYLGLIVSIWTLLLNIPLASSQNGKSTPRGLESGDPPSRQNIRFWPHSPDQKLPNPVSGHPECGFRAAFTLQSRVEKQFGFVTVFRLTLFFSQCLPDLVAFYCSLAMSWITKQHPQIFSRN